MVVRGFDKVYPLNRKYCAKYGTQPRVTPVTPVTPGRS